MENPGLTNRNGSSPGVITTISKLTKTCVLRLTPDHLFFVLSGKVANGGVSMWCELSQVTLKNRVHFHRHTFLLLQRRKSRPHTI